MIKVIYEEQKLPRIGEGLKPGIPISNKKEKLLLEILLRYKSTTHSYNCDNILVTATNAFRVVANRDYLIDKIQNLLQLDVNVVPGIEEARLTFLGCTSEQTAIDSFAVIDIGGGSTEIILGSKNNIKSNCCLPLGVVSLTEEYFLNDPPNLYEIENVKNVIQTQLKKTFIKTIPFQKAIAVAGTPTTLACIKKGMISYNEALIESEILTLNEVGKFSERLSKMSSNEVQNAFASVVAGREDLLLAGTIILYEAMKHIEAKEVVVSSRGVRYGAIYDYLMKTF